MAQWIARETSNLKVAGSSPARVALFARWGISSIGRVPRLQPGGTGIETRILQLKAKLRLNGQVVKALAL